VTQGQGSVGKTDPTAGGGGSSTGLFGKIPAQGDFVRLNASTPAALAFDVFLQESLEALRRAGAELVPEPVRFSFFDAASKTGIYGLFAPSQDAVGRSYPLSVFAALQGEGVAVVPFAAHAFFDTAGDLLAAGAVLSSVELCARARALYPPGLVDGERQGMRRSLHDTGAAWLWQTLFPDAPAEGMAYALRTLKAACDAVKGKPPTGPGIVLDCPAPNKQAALFWLALVDGRLGWQGASPSFFWSASGGGRMLIALGPPPAVLLSFLARPDSQSNKRWPLTTAVPAAREAAVRDLDAGVREAATAQNGSLLDVVTAMEKAP
jgi:type VI secretion system protein ImpM